MVCDKDTNIVYFSELLTKDEFATVCKRIITLLDKYKIKYDYLVETKDIWVRDFMPIQVSSDRFVQFRYEPSYLKDFLDSQSEPKIVCKANNFNPVYSNINLDGGNVVKWSNKVLITDRIFSENPEYTDPKQLIQEIEKLLQTEVIIIPQIKSECTGHADGMVKFIDGNTIFVNDLDFEYKYWSSGMKKIIDKYNFKYFNMPLFVYKDKHYSDTAIGCYMNFLEVGNVIIFPIFDVAANKDKQAMDLITSIYPDKNIEPIIINEIARYGGLMNCISWNIKI